MPMFAFPSRNRWEADVLELFLVAKCLGSGPTTLFGLRIWFLSVLERPLRPLAGASRFGIPLGRVAFLIIALPFRSMRVGPETRSFSHQGMGPLQGPFQVLVGPQGGGLP